MGIEEFFENNRRDFRNTRANSFPAENEYSYNQRSPFNGYRNKASWQNLLDKIRSDKKFKLLVISAGFLLLILVVVLIIVLFPLIIKLINYIAQNGLQGVINSITGFLDKILKGTSN
jgi:hypothetical protein